MPRAFAALAIAVAAFAPDVASAAPCPGRANALGTARTMTVDPREYPRIGTMQYTNTLPLEDKEVILTFDDGPMPPYTNRVLDILAEHCVKATFFIIGRMARGYPDLLKRILADGHTVGTHSQNHVLAFDRMPLHAVQREVEDGIASVAQALGKREAVAPFFRIPGLLRAPQVEGYLQHRTLTTWSADIAGDDWKHITASEVVRRVMERLAEKGKGIVLLHDIQPATALALPELLRDLKAQGYRIVHAVPGRMRGPAHAAATANEPATAAVTATPAAEALQAMARTTPETAAVPAPRPARRIYGPDHAVDTVASAEPPPSASTSRRREPAQQAAEAQAPRRPASEPAEARASAAMPVPSEPRSPQRTAANEAPSDLRPASRAAIERVSRPLASTMKPPRSAATPGKITVLRMEAPPNVVSVPVPGAGGVGVSALVRTSQRPDGRFQQEP